MQLFQVPEVVQSGVGDLGSVKKEYSEIKQPGKSSHA